MMLRYATLISLALCLPGCTSMTVDTGDATAEAPFPLCQAPEQRLSALVLWQPDWRPDQKDVLLRERAAQEGLQQFLARSDCYARFDLRRLVSGNGAAFPSWPNLLSIAATQKPLPDRVLVVTVRELGPIPKPGSATPAEGGTEVVLDLAAFDVFGAQLADFRTHWRNGDAAAIKGTQNLSQDMQAALAAALRPAAPQPLTQP